MKQATKNARISIVIIVLYLFVFSVAILTLFCFSISMLDKVVYILMKCALLFFFLLCFMILYYCHKKYIKNKWATTNRWRYTITVIVFLCFFCVTQSRIADSIVCLKARYHIKSVLNNLDIDKTKVTIDGIETKQKDNILLSLKGLRFEAQHITVFNKYLCVIDSPTENIELLIAPDSIVDNQYWVFYLKYPNTSQNEIGVFNSNSIDLKNP